jgi:hypothetical protein
VAVWQELPKEFKSAVRDEQIEWIKTTRDREARMLMDEGATFAEAYTRVTDARTEYLLETAARFYGGDGSGEGDGGGGSSGGGAPPDGSWSQVAAGPAFPADRGNILLGTWRAEPRFAEGFTNRILAQSQITVVFTEAEATCFIKSLSGERTDRASVTYRFQGNECLICGAVSQNCEKAFYVDDDTVVFQITPVDFLRLKRLN